MKNFKKSLEAAKASKEKGNIKPLYAILATLFRFLSKAKVPFYRRKIAKAIKNVQNEIK